MQIFTFWKKNIEPVQLNKPVVGTITFDSKIIGADFLNEEEAKLTKQWSAAKLHYDLLAEANTRGLSPIEGAKLAMNYQIARAEFEKADAAMKEYVRRVYG